MTRKNIHMAYFCGNALPFEVFYSKNIKLTKIKGNGEVSGKSKSCFPTYMCSYAMNCLDIVWENNVFDGFVFENKCHAMVALYEYLCENMPHKKIIMINIPKTDSLHSLFYYRKEILKLVDFLENEFNIPMSDEIDQQKHFYMKKVMDKKKDIMDRAAVNAVSLTFNDIEILEKCPEEVTMIFDKELRKLEDKSKIKFKNDLPGILLCGIQITPLDIIDVINEYGGKVILYDNFETNNLNNKADDICNWNSGWLKEFEQKIDKYNIRGIIFSAIKFCPIQSYGVLLLVSLAKRKKIPFLVLNDSFSNYCSAQSHARIQAFLECLE